jgi:transcription elongation factor SPT6
MSSCRVKINFFMLFKLSIPLLTYEFFFNFKDEKRDKISEMKRLEEYILDKRPKLIIISAENKDALNIMDDLNDLIKKMQLDHNMHSINIELIDNEVAKLIDSSHHCQQYFAQSSSNHSLIKQAVTLARFVQDPLLCCSQLFNNDRDILGMKLHAIQNLLISTSGGRNSIDASDLLHHLEIEFVNIANEVGVDLNRCNQTPHTSNVLQFVSGLGLRKSQYLLKILRQERLALKSTLPFDKQLKTYPVIVNRLSLVTKCQLGRRVFINSAGFIKFDVDFISKEIDEDEDSSDKSDDAMCTEPLDSTRIHPETYEWARKMAIDALDFDDTTENPNPISALKEILENPKRLKDLDLDAFAEELLRTGHGNKIVTLYDIRQELNYRFRDKRVAFQSMSNEEKFYCLLNETPFSFHVGKLILCKVTGIVRRRPNKEQLDEANPIKDDNTCTWQCSFCKRNDFTELSKVWTHFDTGECPGPAIGIRTMLDNGCQGFLSLKMLSDNPVNNPDDRIKVGMVIHARVREIQVDKFRIDLTSRTSDLKDLNDQFKPQKDRFYDFGSEEEDRNKLIDKKKKEEHKQTYTKRVISHPQFKNYAYAQAVNMLKDQSIGDCIIRPSSKGADHLTATWKVYDDCFQHVDILEEKKANVFSIGKRLIIDGEDYEDLDEILARYINPMANFVKEIISHKNFKPLNQIDASLNEKTQFTNSKPSELCLQSCEKLLAQERLKNPSRIPYMFIVCLNFPGRFLLLYTVKSKPRYEFIKVTSEGFVFREKRFNNFNELLSWFKVHFNDYVPPPPPPSKPQESIQPPPIETNNDYSDSFTSMNISDPPRNDSYNERGGSRPYNNDNNRPFNQNGSNYNRNNNTNNNSNNRSFGRGGGDDRRNRGFNNSGRGGFDRNRGGFRNNNNKSFGSSGVGGGGGSQRPYETPQQPMQRADNYENWDGDALKSGKIRSREISYFNPCLLVIFY